MVGGCIENLCRICSGPGGHNIFAPIPVYLHENRAEYSSWNKNISLLISEVIGLPVIKNDGLPQQICVICISYLKHASIFRQQAINNILSIKTAKLLEETDNCSLKSKQSVKTIDNDDNFKKYDKTVLLSDNNQMSDNIKAYGISNYRRNLKKITNDGYKNNLNNIKNNLSDESDTTEDDEDQMTSSDNNKLNDEENVYHLKPSVIKNLINYNETNFEEDDITTLDIFKNNNIIFNIPEHFKERKCHTCRRCFMFKETYEDHINGCIELKFVQFINDVKQLLKLKRTKTLSSYEFIRRIIYAIKKGYMIINEYCNEFNISDDLQNDSPSISDNKIKLKNYDIDNFSLISFDDNKPLFNKTSILDNKSKTPNTITDNSVDEYDDENEEVDIDSNDNNIMDEVIPDKLLINKSVFMSCKHCNINFSNLICLEDHNYKYHNDNIINLLHNNNNNDDDDDDFIMDGIVNIIDSNLLNLNKKSAKEEQTYFIDKKSFNINVKTPNLVNNVSNNCNMKVSLKSPTKNTSTVINNKKLNNSLAKAFATVSAIKLSSQPTFLNQFNNYNINTKDLKTVKCMKCDKQFITISHLDEHLSRSHKH